MPVPSMLSAWIPQIADILLPRIADIFRKDTRVMKEAVDAEIASLGRAQSELKALMNKQGEAFESLRLQNAGIERRLDQLLERQESTARQIAELQQHVQASSSPSAALLWAVLVVGVLGLGVGVSVLALHR